ncbi:MAG: sporulation protein [Oscillospiraceae bacterium]|nr:sporulation protein [Oscillospiraceae bacterium]
MKRKREKTFLERTAEMFDLPGEVTAGQSFIAVTGNGRVYIDGHRGILEYGEERISVRCGKMIASVEGLKLKLCAMSERELLVTGKLHSITFRE